MRRWMIIAIVIGFFNNDVYATHAAGMDISYECVGSSGGGSGVSITVTINTQAWGNEISWDITSGGIIYASGNGYNSYSTYTITACVPAGALVFNMYDSWGDGWNGGTYTISGNPTLSGQVSGGLTGSTSFGSNNFSVSGGAPCTFTSNNAYKVTLRFYRDCSNGISAPNTFTLDVNPNNCSGVSGFSATMSMISGPTSITPICPQAGNPCTNSSIVGIEEYVYQTTITLPSQCTNWTLRVCLCCRNYAINTIANPGGQELCVEATINNTALCNNSPTFTQYPVPYICSNTPFCYNNGALDPDGDSLVYSLITPMNNGGTVNYTGAFSTNNPVGGFTTFDPVSGNLCMNAPNQLTSVFAIMVQEYRNGILIGSVIRDIQINVLVCTEPPPYLSGIDTLVQVDTSAILSTYEICTNVGDTIDFNINGLTNSSITNLTMSWNNAIPSATFTVTNNGTANPVGNFYWIPTAADTNSPYYFVVDVEDDACPLMGSFSFSYEIILKSTSNISITPNVTNVSCAGYNDGAINIAIGGINTPPSFNWTDPNGNFIGTVQNPNNLDSGMYTVIVSAPDECSATADIYVDMASAMNFSSVINNIDCFGNNNGSITPNLNGGTSPFTYLWSNGNTNQNLTNLSAGNYSLSVSDSNGCTLSDFYIITEPPLLSATTNVSNVSCNGLNNGGISLSISGGVMDYMINAAGFSQTLSGGVNIFNTPNLLPADTFPYSVIDSNGCVFLDTVIITEPPILTVNENIQHVSCFGLANGSATLTISGGTPMYTENWGVINPSSLSGGVYSYTVTDLNGCIYNDSVEINEPAVLATSFVQNNVTTCSGSNGSIDITVSGGSLPYSFLWNNGSPLEDLNNIPAGIYSVVITDDNGCVDSINTTITQPPTPTLNAIEGDVSCYNFNDGSIDLSVLGGTGPFTFSWSNGANTEDLINLSAGAYSVMVTDSNNCFITANLNIDQPTEITSIAATSNVNCYGGNDGTINLIISGGISPYIEDWGGYNPLSLHAGTYTCIITDSANCTDTNEVLITEPPVLLSVPVITDISCNGWNDGTINLNLSGGVPPYIEDWGGYNPNSLTIGVYSYIITDFNGCIFNDSVMMTEPDSLLVNHITTDVSCNGWNDGTANLTPSGGVLPYIEDWGVNNPDSLTAGVHNYTVIDSNGCTFTDQILINEPLGLNVIIDTSRVSCFGLSDGSVSLSISGGIPPYTENWYGYNPASLSSGVYDFTITYNSDCTYQGQAIITEPNDITTNEIISNVSCFGLSDGSVSLQIFGGTSPYTENWNGVNINTLPKGNYSYAVTDVNGCVKNDFVTINEPDTLRVSATVIDANCFNSNDGQIYLSPIGGTSPYTENWNGNNHLALVAGNYNFSITDANGCVFDSNAVVNQANEIILSFDAQSPICRNDSSVLNINIENPTSEFYTITIDDSLITTEYLIDSSGLLFPSGLPLIVSPNQTTNFVIITVEDENGCATTPGDTALVTVHQLPVLDIGLTNVCKADPSFTLTQATPIGGNYFIEGIQTDFFDVENLEVGIYSIRYDYTDLLTLCSNSIEKNINIHPSPIASFTFSPKVTDSLNGNVLFVNTSENIYSLEWYSDSIKISDTTEFWYTFGSIGEYEISLVVSNTFNCTDTATDSLVVNPVYSIFIPNSFTPGNDNKNEDFGPILNAYKQYNMIIYNRWGEAIFKGKDMNWDGKVNNEFAPPGVYSYFIEVIDFKDKSFEYAGIIHLIR